MGPADLIAIVQIIQAAIAAAPQAIAIIEKGKAFVTSLFEAGLISKVQQDAVHAHVDAVTAAVIAGNCPPEFIVEPDPQ